MIDDVLKVNPLDKKIFVLDNFYEDPDKVREFALDQEFAEDVRFYKGLRTVENFEFSGTKEIFEELIGEKITDYDGGRFQITSAENPQVYHCDLQKWAAIVYLTPYAPVASGTRTHVSLRTGIRSSAEATDDIMGETFSGGFYDSNQFDTVDNIGNVYNRMVIFNGHLIHSAGPYFGLDMWSGRLIHLFFFNSE